MTTTSTTTNRIRTTTLALGLGLATGGTALAQVDIDEVLCSSTSATKATDLVLGQVDSDSDQNSGFEWIDASQNSLAASSTASGASAHGHCASEAQLTQEGFQAWAYAYGSSWTKPGQEASYNTSGGGQYGFVIEYPTRVEGHVCGAADTPFSTGQVRAVLWGETDAGFVRPVDHVVGNGPDCHYFEFILEPGEYEFNLHAWLRTDNIGDGQYDEWGEIEAELKFDVLAHPDVDFDGDVDGADLAKFLGAWGTDLEEHDFNGDGIVDGADLAILLGAWTD